MFRFFQRGSTVERPPADTDERAAWLRRLRHVGPDLRRIVGPEDGASPTGDWVGAVISLSGEDKRFPSLDDALSDGLFGPNCRNGIEHYIPSKHEAEALFCTRLAVAAMQRRRAGNPPEEYFLDEDPAAEDRREFEKLYSAARLAEGGGKTEEALHACRRALSLLERDLFGEKQDIVREALEARVRTLERERNATTQSTGEER